MQLSTSSYGAGYCDVYLVRTDAGGNQQWSQTFGGSSGDGGWSIQQTGDGGYIIAGLTSSYGAGSYDVWLIKLGSESFVEYSNIPQAYEFCLHPPFPNPFNAETTVSFTLPTGEYIELSVYDVLGKKVAELAKGEYSAGNHQVEFNGSSLVSGVYFIRLSARNQTHTQKCLLIK